MHPTFPCPNPVCTHTFAPDAVRGSSSLVCPKCGTVFQFGPASAAPPRPVTPPKRPAPSSVKPTISPPSVKPSIAPPKSPAPPQSPAPAALPIAQPVIANKMPAAPPAGDAPAALNFHSPSELVVPRTRRTAEKEGKRSLLSWIVLALLGVLGLALLGWGAKWLSYFLKTNTADEEAGRTPSVYNSRFSWPGKPWTRDQDIQFRLHVHIGMASPRHNSGLGLVFKDYKNRRPSDAEMLDDALSKLRSYFKGVEWELKKDAKVRLAGQPAQVVEFQGVDGEDVTMNGECYMTTFRGYGYWFFTWAPLGELEQDGESIHSEWTQLRQRLALLDGRKGWTERPPETEKVAGKKAAYQLAYIKGLWTRETTEDYDPQADLVLKGHEPDPERKPLAGKDATVEVLVLPKQADLKAAAAAARAYVLEREKKLYPRTTVDPIKDKSGAEIDRAADIGTEHGHLSKLHMKNTEDLERYLLIAVVNRKEGVVVLVGQCLWERHDFWDQELMVLLKTFKALAR